MSSIAKSVALLMFAVLASCDTNPVIAGCCDVGHPGVRVVNGYTLPIDIYIDGSAVASSVPAAAIDTVTTTSGSHTFMIRPAGSASSSTQTISATSGALPTVAVVSASGSISTTILDDTNNVVPVNATKLRVLHFAPNAGTLQVYRTQPDFPTPVAWQTPFTYQPDPTSLSAPFYQSTFGNWEVRIWQTPADASGWSTAPLRILIPLASGQKRTIVILDKPGGGVRAEVI